MIDWQKDCKNAMWSMYWLNPTPSGDDVEADKQAVRENVARLVRMLTQKGGGRRGEKNMINVSDLPLIEVSILIAVTRLALEGFFGEMPEKVEREVFWRNNMPEKVKWLNRTCEYCGNQMNSWDAKLTKALQSKNCCENCFCKIYDMDKEAFRETMENYLGIRPCMGI